MYFIGYFIVASAKVIDVVLTIYLWIIIARAILSWVNPDPYNPIVRFIHNITEPLLYRVRSRVPIFFGGIDFSPLIVLLVIYFLKIFLVQSLYRFGSTLV